MKTMLPPRRTPPSAEIHKTYKVPHENDVLKGLHKYKQIKQNPHEINLTSRNNK